MNYTELTNLNELNFNIIIYRKKSTEAKAKNDMIEAHKNELLNSQIWALLPSFCNNASDVKENFKASYK